MKKVLGIAVFIILLLFILGLPISENIQKGLIVLDFAAVFWILEILPLPVTALSVPVLGVLLGVDSVKGALSSFAHPIIFLFFGGFALAAALQKYSIDKFIAWKIVSLSKGSLFLSSVFLFLATAFVSMWISNTSTTAMVLPLALGILGTAKGDWRLKHFVLLGIAYSASVGGIGTVVGSPPNGITAAELDMTFTDWLRFGLPTVAVLLPLLVAVLYAYFRPDFSSSLSIESFELKFGKKEKLVLLVFGITVLLWLLGKPISHAVGVKKYFDAVVAILAVVLLFVLNLVNWREIEEHTDWGTLLLFGGGITLSHFLKISGASKFIANSFVGFVSHFPPYLIVLSVVMFMIFMTELMSNTATAAIFVPILITAAQTLGMKPVELALSAGIAASCAFMLPVATPPNAIVYGTGEIKQKYMISAGLILNLLFSIAIALLILFIL